MRELLEKINGIVWGVPGVCMILSVGMYYTVRTGAAQIRLFPKALRTFLRQFGAEGDTGGISGYQALCTALAATVGTGNLAGVAGAICIGGPGAVFWMWICGFFGMIIKAAEATLAVRYRKKDRLGNYVAGPMYMIEMGMGKKWRWLAVLYSFFGIFACFGVGNATQINAALDSIESVALQFQFPLPAWFHLALGLFAAVLIITVLKGGAQGIGRAAEKLVPFAAAGYLLLGVFVLIIKADKIPAALNMIVRGAFLPKAVTGGMVGSFFLSLRTGAARGVFTNEAGMGTAAIAHGASIVKDPIEQGLMGIIEVFIDTIVICTVTALVVVLSGITETAGGLEAFSSNGAAAAAAFNAILPGIVGGTVIQIGIIFFALSSILSWTYYGERCLGYLTGNNKGINIVYKVVFVGICIVGTTGSGKVMWNISDTLNGLMALPNLLAILLLSDVVAKMTEDYFNKNVIK